MKRILALLIIIVMVTCAVPVFAVSSNDTYSEYIVKFKDGYSPFCDARLMSVGDGEIETVIEDWNVYTITGDVLNYIDKSKVEYVEPNYRAVLLDDYPNDPKYLENRQSYLPMTGVPEVWRYAEIEPRYFASNVKVAVIDSGVDTDHPDFADTTIYAYDYSRVNGAGEVIISTDNVHEETLHGSSVAGIISAGFNDGIGVAGMTKAAIYSLKVFEGSSAGYANICKAIKDAVDEYDCDVINMSLGFYSNTGEVIPTSEIQLLQNVINNAANKGAVVVAASGNFGNMGGADLGNPNIRYNPVVYPAYCDKVISVGAVQSSGVIAAFSTYNDRVDVVAPGRNIYTVKGNYDDDTQFYWLKSGTSVASPQVAAAVAIIKGVRPETTYEDIEDMIEEFSVDLGDAGKDNYYGWGLLDVAAMARNVFPNVAKVTPAKPAYNKSQKTVDITYFAPKNREKTSISARLAIYDENGRLIRITEPCDLEFLNSQEEDNVATESVVYQDVVFDGVDIPSDGYAKIFCMKWGKIIPMTETVNIEAE